LSPLNKEILRLALPSILANLTVPLVGLVDIAVAGHLDSSAAALIGGISIGSLMFDLMYWNFGFLRAGTGGMTAQAFGREDWGGCSAILKKGVVTALLAALLLLLIQWPFQKLIFVFVQCSDEVKALALKYFYIRVWAAPATLSLMALRGWFIGMQDTFSSMLTDVVVNGVNILCSILLTLGIPRTSFNGIGFVGIAWGTIIAQYSGLLFAAAVVFIKYRSVMLSIRTALRLRLGTVSCESGSNALGRPFSRTGREAQGAPAPFAAGQPQTTGTMREFFTVNRDLFVRSLCLMAIYLSFSAISARFGDTYLAMCSIMMKLMLIFSYFTDGFAFAGEALTGRFIGARDSFNLSETVKWTFVWSMGIGILFIGIYTLAGIPMFRMMTADKTVIEAAREYIPWLAVIPLLGCPAFTWDGIYTGATATREMRDANIGCVLSFFAVWFIGLIILKTTGGTQVPSRAKVHLLFGAYYAHLLFRSLYQTVKYNSAVKAKLS
jgi:MATE family multidrug resistance protein